MKNKLELVLKILEKHYGKRGSRIVVCFVLIVFGFKNSDIFEAFGVSQSALRRYRAALDAGKINQLFKNGGSRRKSELEKYSAKINIEFENNPPKTLRDAQERINIMTGVKLSLFRIGVYLKKKGLKVEQ